MMTVSLIISTYNWPQALRLCIESILRQTVLPDEILVADDGSKDDTRELVTHIAANAPIPIHHIWHEDNGFRLAAIRNRAIAASHGDYIVQIDGDVILERHFIEDHKHFARKGYFASGSRAMIGEELTKKLLDGDPISLSPLQKGIHDVNNAIRIPILSLFFRGHKPTKAKGCNMGFWREDLFAVNGYDESFVGWGGEETELAERLRNIGRAKRAIKFCGILYHLHHPIASRENTQNNRELILHSKRERRTRCIKGLDQYPAILP